MKGISIFRHLSSAMSTVAHDGSLSLGANIFLSRLKKDNTDTRILTLSGTVPRMVPAKDLDIATHMAPGTT